MKYSKFKIKNLITKVKNTFFFLIFLFSCQNNPAQEPPISVGANQTKLYFEKLNQKKVGVITNHTGILVSSENRPIIHLIDTLLRSDIQVEKIFVPEHGFSGLADAGEFVKDSQHKTAQIPIISLYGKNKKPSPEQLQNIDILLFDLQDVGVRFFTYLSTLHYVMEACAEQNIPLIVLDRPNPNAHYIDGPVLNPKFKSFVGLHPVPIVYAMTIGEYAQMINGEKWLSGGVKCPLEVIPMKNYSHQKKYDLPIKPSPNLPNGKAVNLYPSLCFFEGTNVSVGRGTNLQFQIYGSPYLEISDFQFTPSPNEGAKNPPHNGKICYGENLTQSSDLQKINLEWILKSYQQNSTTKNPFFNSFFEKLAGTDQLRKQIQQQIPEEEIRKSWEKEINDFKKIRKKYLIY